MIRFYGPEPPSSMSTYRIGGECPGCDNLTRWTRSTSPMADILRPDNMSEVVLTYSCDACFEPIPVRWTIERWPNTTDPRLGSPSLVRRATAPFDFDHVPDPVRIEIEEALDCLSVDAYNGFAAVSRRAVQALCTNLGADATSKVKNQINQMAELSGLSDDLKELAEQVMLSGHDGSHPHLPPLDEARARLLLELMRDLTYELYTRPGKVRQAAELRTAAIETARPD